MSTPRSSFFQPLARFYALSYTPDYLGYILLQLSYLASHYLITPFHRTFSLSDLTKSHPYLLPNQQRVTSLQNILLAGVAPLVLFVIWSLTARPRFHKIHVTILGFVISLTLTSFLTDVTKNLVGRPRPDLLARCQARDGTEKTGLVDYTVCTNPDLRVLNDGFRSFPSGHSSFSFSGLGYLSLWIAGQLRVARPRSGFAGVWLCMIPLLAAGYVALSRVSDYRHDAADVSVGSALGMGVAWLSYRQYFRGLRDKRCDEPWRSRADVERIREAKVGDRIDEERGLTDEFELEDTGSSAPDTEDEIDETVDEAKARTAKGRHNARVEHG